MVGMSPHHKTAYTVSGLHATVPLTVYIVSGVHATLPVNGLHCFVFACICLTN